MFTHLKNIETAFQHIKRFSYLVIIACTLICGFAVYKAYDFAANAGKHIYILANGKALEALPLTARIISRLRPATISGCFISSFSRWTPMKR